MQELAELFYCGVLPPSGPRTNHLTSNVEENLDPEPYKRASDSEMNFVSVLCKNVQTLANFPDVKPVYNLFMYLEFTVDKLQSKSFLSTTSSFSQVNKPRTPGGICSCSVPYSGQ